MCLRLLGEMMSTNELYAYGRKSKASKARYFGQVVFCQNQNSGGFYRMKGYTRNVHKIH